MIDKSSDGVYKSCEVNILVVTVVKAFYIHVG